MASLVIVMLFGYCIEETKNVLYSSPHTLSYDITRCVFCRGFLRWRLSLRPNNDDQVQISSILLWNLKMIHKKMWVSFFTDFEICCDSDLDPIFTKIKSAQVIISFYYHTKFDSNVRQTTKSNWLNISSLQGENNGMQSPSIRKKMWVLGKKRISISISIVLWCSVCWLSQRSH